MSIKRTFISRLNRTPLVDKLVYTSRYGLAKGLKRQGGLGWLPSFIPRLNEWKIEERFLQTLDFRGLTVYDIGGDQGLFTLFFASRVGEEGHVVTFEPNERSLQRIEKNVAINGFSNVTIIPRGLAELPGKLRFSYPEYEPALGSVTEGLAEGVGGNPEAELTARNMITCVVDVDSLDNAIARDALPRPDFIKLDVEGMEYPALKGMAVTLSNFRPGLYIEIHGKGHAGKLANVRNVVTFLKALDYPIRHIESGRSIDAGNVEDAVEGHLYCEGRNAAHSQ